MRAVAREIDERGPFPTPNQVEGNSNRPILRRHPLNKSRVPIPHPRALDTPMRIELCVYRHSVCREPLRQLATLPFVQRTR